MKITKEKLNEVVQDDEGKPFEDGTTFGKLLRSAARAQAYVENGRPTPFQESDEDKFRMGMVCYKLNDAVKQSKALVLSIDDTRLLRSRAAKVFDPPTFVAVKILLEGTMSAEKQAEKENEKGGEEEKKS